MEGVGFLAEQHFVRLGHIAEDREIRGANDRSRLGLFDTCPRDATTLRIAPV